MFLSMVIQRKVFAVTVDLRRGPPYSFNCVILYSALSSKRDIMETRKIIRSTEIKFYRLAKKDAGKPWFHSHYIDEFLDSQIRGLLSQPCD